MRPGGAPAGRLDWCLAHGRGLPARRRRVRWRQLAEDYITQRYPTTRRASRRRRAPGGVAGLRRARCDERLGVRTRSELLAHPQRQAARVHQPRPPRAEPAEAAGAWRRSATSGPGSANAMPAVRALGGWIERVVFSDHARGDARSRWQRLPDSRAVDARHATTSCPSMLGELLDPVLARRRARHSRRRRPAPTGTAASPTTTCTWTTPAMGDGLVLYPHFHEPQVVPGWLDKAWKRRHRASPAPGQRRAAARTVAGVGGHAAGRQAARPRRLQAPIGDDLEPARVRVSGGGRWPKASRLADEFAALVEARRRRCTR